MPGVDRYEILHRLPVLTQPACTQRSSNHERGTAEKRNWCYHRITAGCKRPASRYNRPHTDLWRRAGLAPGQPVYRQDGQRAAAATGNLMVAKVDKEFKMEKDVFIT
jgi:hypothetical protein